MAASEVTLSKTAWTSVYENDTGAARYVTLGLPTDVLYVWRVEDEAPSNASLVGISRRGHEGAFAVEVGDGSALYMRFDGHPASVNVVREV